MKDAAFQELLTSIRQAGRIRRGTLKPGRVTSFRPADVKSIREKLKASQAEFALMIGISVATLRKIRNTFNQFLHAQSRNVGFTGIPMFASSANSIARE